jgi:L-fuconolactonase
MLVCDAQVHAPNMLDAPIIPGIDYEDLLAEMATAGVDRAVIVPLAEGVDPGPALEFVRRSPDRFAVMARVPAGDPRAAEDLPRLKATPGIKGIRISFFSEPAKSQLAEDRMEWLWEAATQVGLPVMINAPGSLHKVGQIAARHPGLRLVVDHMGLIPFHKYADLMPAIPPLVALAQHANVAVKATALPSSIDEPYPFPTLHEPVRRVVDAFGPPRVFWGSDLTRLPCTYLECRRLFTDAMDFLSEPDREWIMGRGICEWLGWPVA